MKTYEVIVNVDVANELLNKNVYYDRNSEGQTNRPVSRLRVMQYASAMLRGEWKLTHQGVAIDTNGKLVDGQHRLLAVVAASEKDPDISIPMMVNEDVNPEVFEVIDTGGNRTGKDILALMGERDTIALHAAIRHLFLFRNVPYYQWNRFRVSNHQILETLESDPSIRDDVQLSKQLVQIGLIGTAAAVGMYVCREAYPPRMEEFIDGLRTGVGLQQRDPRLVLRNNLTRSRNLSSTMRRYDTRIHLAMFIKSWNDFVNNRTRELISWRNNESFPVPTPPKNDSDES